MRHHSPTHAISTEELQYIARIRSWDLKAITKYGGTQVMNADVISSCYAETERFVHTRAPRTLKQKTWNGSVADVPRRNAGRLGGETMTYRNAWLCAWGFGILLESRNRGFLDHWSCFVEVNQSQSSNVELEIEEVFGCDDETGKTRSSVGEGKEKMQKCCGAAPRSILDFRLPVIDSYSPLLAAYPQWVERSMRPLNAHDSRRRAQTFR